jgi:hypothetical protein
MDGSRLPALSSIWVPNCSINAGQDAFHIEASAGMNPFFVFARPSKVGDLLPWMRALRDGVFPPDNAASKLPRSVRAPHGSSSL